MLRLTFLLCFLPLFFCSCPNGSYEWHSNCYQFVVDATEFLDAEAHCVSIGGHLTSIHDGFANSFLTSQAKNIFGSHIDDFWIGLSDTQTLGKLTWSDGTPLDYLEWDSNQPGSLTVNNCGAVNIRNGFWKIDNFFKQKPYICNIGNASFNTVTSPPPRTTITTTTMRTTTLRSTRKSSTTPVQNRCTGNFTYFYATNSCYGVFYTSENRGKNWNFGENLCKSFGAHLASMHSDAEVNFVIYLPSIKNSNFFPWIGLYSDDHDNWRWSDGTPVDYLPGNPEAGANMCAFINENNNFEAHDCRDDLTVLCKK